MKITDRYKRSRT